MSIPLRAYLLIFVYCVIGAFHFWYTASENFVGYLAHHSGISAFALCLHISICEREPRISLLLREVCALGVVLVVILSLFLDLISRHYTGAPADWFGLQYVFVRSEDYWVTFKNFLPVEVLWTIFLLGVFYACLSFFGPLGPPIKRGRYRYLTLIILPLSVFLGFVSAHSQWLEDKPPLKRFLSQALRAQHDVSLALETTSQQRSVLTETLSAPSHIVLMVLESFRADFLDSELAANLSKFRSESIQFTNAFSPITYTVRAFESFLCNVRPSTFGKKIDRECLPSFLRNRGYETLYVSSSEGSFEAFEQLLSDTGFSHTITAEDFGSRAERLSYFSVSEERLLPEIKDWLHAHGAKKTFLTLLNSSSHHPYYVPHTPLGSPLTEFKRYKHAISYTDSFFNKVVELYKEAGLIKNTVFIVFADHGEGFGEHGRWLHDSVIWNEGIKVPFFIFGKTLVPSMVYQEAFSIRYLLPLVKHLFFGKPSIELPNYVYSRCLMKQRCASLIDYPLKYIHHFGFKPDQVFDLSKDPFERNDMYETLSPNNRIHYLRSLLLWYRETDM